MYINELAKPLAGDTILLGQRGNIVQEALLLLRREGQEIVVIWVLWSVKAGTNESSHRAAVASRRCKTGSS